MCMSSSFQRHLKYISVWNTFFFLLSFIYAGGALEHSIFHGRPSSQYSTVIAA